jgi:hypothetical protein
VGRWGEQPEHQVALKQLALVRDRISTSLRESRRPVRMEVARLMSTTRQQPDRSPLAAG